MKNNDRYTLLRELRQAGAPNKDLHELSVLGVRLRSLGRPVRSTGIQRYTPAIIGGAIGLIVGIASVVVAQASIPGQPFYTMKRASEQGVTAINPDFRELVMLRRVLEVNTLIDHKAPSPVILASLERYQSAAADYKYHDTEDPESKDTPIIIYCKQTLKAAADKTTGPEHHAIVRIVATL